MWILIAFVVAIGLTALAIMAIFGEFGTASTQQTAQSVLSTASSVISNLQTDYAGNPNFSGLSNTTVANDGAVPNTWTASANGFSIPGGGTASFAPASVNGGTNNGFTMTLSNLNQQACAQFGTYYDSNTVSISINGTAADNPDYNGGSGSGTSGTSGTSWPPSLAGDCQSGNNTVVITEAGE